MFDCTSYPASNIGDYRGLSDAATAAGALIPDWQRLGFPDKPAWKQWKAAQEAAAAGSSGGGITNMPGPSSSPGGGSTGGAGAIDQVTDKAPGSSSGGGFLSGIPTMYLLIGGAIVVFMVLGKK